jgi:hypothetical protein
MQHARSLGIAAFVHRCSLVFKVKRGVLIGQALGHNAKAAKIFRNFRCLDCQLAEREGFEPPIRLPVCRISSAVRSTTLPPLRGREGRGKRPFGRAGM